MQFDKWNKKKLLHAHRDDLSLVIPIKFNTMNHFHVFSLSHSLVLYQLWVFWWRLVSFYMKWKRVKHSFYVLCSAQMGINLYCFERESLVNEYSTPYQPWIYIRKCEYVCITPYQITSMKAARVSELAHSSSRTL